MEIVVRLDVMLALRKMKARNLADQIGISEQNVSLLHFGHLCMDAQIGIDNVSAYPISCLQIPYRTQGPALQTV